MKLFSHIQRKNGKDKESWRHKCSNNIDTGKLEDDKLLSEIERLKQRIQELGSNCDDALSESKKEG
ncbi:MAG: hypothetical protein ACE5J2_01650 [Nitrososphaerales archaeon]